MKRTCIGVLLLVVCGGLLRAVDLSGFGGLAIFNPAQIESAGSGSPTEDLHFLGNLTAVFDITNVLRFHAIVEQDPLLMNRIIPMVEFNIGYFNLNLGPFIGSRNFFKSEINPGISMGLDFSIPGIVFGALRFDSTINAGIFPGNFLQEYREVRAGFWVPYAVVTLGSNTRTILEKQGNTGFISQWERYFFAADVYEKNIPWTLRVDLGFQRLNWLIQERPREGYHFNSIYAGLEIGRQINYSLRIYVAGEFSVYSWESQNLTGAKPFTATVFGDFRLGAVWHIKSRGDR
jgi:hypothetical protein